MNERIIEIANEANKSVGYQFQLEDAKQLHELMDKFAELIILKCAETIQDFVEHRIPASEYPIRLKRYYFGVEE